MIADYVHVKQETAPTEELSKKTDRVIKEKSNDPGLEVRFNNIRFVGAEVVSKLRHLRLKRVAAE